MKELLQQALTVLKEWDALIKHQYSGTSEAMTDMQYAAWNTVDAIKALEAELAKPEQGEVVVTKNPQGQIVAVTRQYRILKVIATSAKTEQDYIKQLEDNFRKQLDELSERNYKLKFELADIKLAKIEQFKEPCKGDSLKCGLMGQALVSNPDQAEYSDIVSDGGLDPRNKFDAQPEQDHGFDRTASHMAGEYVDTAEQEPVATVTKIMHNETYYEGYFDSHIKVKVGTKLYTSPPRKEWVGLTDEEIISAEGFFDYMTNEELIYAVRELEAKLKEKNT